MTNRYAVPVTYVVLIDNTYFKMKDN